MMKPKSLKQIWETLCQDSDFSKSQNVDFVVAKVAYSSDFDQIGYSLLREPAKTKVVYLYRRQCTSH